MLHWALVNNLLTAVGSAPYVARPHMPHQAKGYPAGVQLALVPFGERALRHFLFLERPEGMELVDAEGFDPVRSRRCRSCGPTDIVPWGQEFHTVGHLYRSIQAGIVNLADKLGEEQLFIGPQEAQATPESFGWPQLVPITDAATASRGHRGHRRAGRGRPRRLERRRTTAASWPCSTSSWRSRQADPTFEPAHPVVAAGVRPVDGVHPDVSSPTRSPPRCPTCSTSSTTSSSRSSCASSPTSARTAEQLGILAHTAVPDVRGDQAARAAARRLPVGPEHPGVTAGANFQLFYQKSFLLPHRRATWIRFTERLDEAAEFADDIAADDGGAVLDDVAKSLHQLPSVLGLADRLTTAATPTLDSVWRPPPVGPITDDDARVAARRVRPHGGRPRSRRGVPVRRVAAGRQAVAADRTIPDWATAAVAAAAAWTVSAGDGDRPAPTLVAHAWAIVRGGGGTPIDDVASGATGVVRSPPHAARRGRRGLCRHGRRRRRLRHGPALPSVPWPRTARRTGSLARVGLPGVRVLPKVLTPAGGISLRSLARYACVRRPGVGAVWHKVPAQRTGSIHAASGQPPAVPVAVARPGQRLPTARGVSAGGPGAVRLLRVHPAERFDLDLVDRVLTAALDEVDAVDMVVLPESAVPDTWSPTSKPSSPVTAWASWWPGSRTPDTRRPICRATGCTSVSGSAGGGGTTARTSTTAGRSTRARSSSTTSAQRSIRPALVGDDGGPRRSIQFLEFGGGITLVAVCEDLARLDAVAELLRTVGPTLVVTVLLDGPQLASRWTARYASVLADDPGSAVLTLTSFNAAARRVIPCGAKGDAAVWPRGWRRVDPTT